jgi:hypothetical protein
MPGDINQLSTTLGYPKAEIVEAIGVMELFAGFNRFARTMSVKVGF